MIDFYRILDNSIIFSILIYCVTFLFSDTIGYTFIRIAFILGFIKILIYNDIYFNWDFLKKYLKPIIIFFCVIFLSIIIHGFEYISILQYERLIKAIIPFITVLFFVSNKKHICWMILLLFLGMIINDFYALYDYVVNHNYRTNGIDMGILYFAGILLLQLPMLLINIINKNITCYQKLVLYFLLLLTLFTIYTNGSRMPWLISIIDILFIIFICIKSWYKKFFVFLGVILVLVSMYIFNSNVNTKINNLFNTNDISTRGHYFYLKDGFNLFLNNKIIGVGLDNFKYALIENNAISKESLENLKQDFHAEINGQYVIPHAHNDIIMFLSELGILGGVAYLYMFGSIAIQTLKEWYSSNNIYALSIFLMTINIFFRGLFDYNIANLGVISVYFFLFSIYLKYNYVIESNIKYIIDKKYILSIYGIFIFINLLSGIIKYLFYC
ncbi:MAG: O-antigen ligase family protein [Megamonas funiformis]|uniref:O-antigen ligase family protein n=1 Tax=Megamonas funiformis TaxID=437897 RepID=UPI002A7F67E2|nr:O-antigen ligase family protein [Megamonas funiformis]MDY3875542.1 O-antigen ligase family protein [Megamonas funiformis]